MGADDSKLSVYTVNYPLKYFAERIGGDLVTVEFPAPPDVDPVYWSPDAETISAYQTADLILLNGASYAKWVEVASLPQSKLVNTSRAFSDSYVTVEGTVTHSHGPEGEHSHGEAAFTTWLDPTLAKRQAGAILEAFVRAQPDRQDEFMAGFESLEQELTELDMVLEELVAGVRSQPLLTSHPVYQYLARGYRLNLLSVHFEPDEFPSARAWRELTQLLTSHPASWMLWEAEPLEETAARLRELGVESAVFDPCANTPAEGDYRAVMRRNLDNLESVFAEPTTE
jgi:zinc transport system substrate-binding protein